MDRLAAMELFVRVVGCGNFSAAARELGVGQPAVSKQVAALEAHLGAQLLRRSARSVTLTEAGQEFFESALRLVDDLEAAESRVGRRQRAPSGLVRVSAVPVFARLHILPRLADFYRRYADIDVELQISERTVDLVHDAIDVALVNGPVLNGSAVARQIAITPVVTVATAAYLKRAGVPKQPGDLERHQCITFVVESTASPWRFVGPLGPGDEIVHHPQGRLRTNDAEQIRAAVLLGLGVAHAPGWLFADEIAAGRVRRVLRDYERAPLPISAVHAAGRRLPAKVRALIDYLADAFAADPSLALPTGK